MTIQEVADRLGVHYMTAYRYVRQGRLPATRLGAEWRIDQSDVDALRTTARRGNGQNKGRPPCPRAADAGRRQLGRVVAPPEPSGRWSRSRRRPDRNGGSGPALHWRALGHRGGLRGGRAQGDLGRATGHRASWAAVRPAWEGPRHGRPRRAIWRPSRTAGRDSGRPSEVARVRRGRARREHSGGRHGRCRCTGTPIAGGGHRFDSQRP